MIVTLSKCQPFEKKNKVDKRKSLNGELLPYIVSDTPEIDLVAIVWYRAMNNTITKMIPVNKQKMGISINYFVV